MIKEFKSKKGVRGDFSVNAVIALVFVLTVCCVGGGLGSITAYAAPRVFSHRGDQREWRENTMPAFSSAIVNSDGIELDVTETADGQLVVLHDNDLSRIAGVNKNVWDMTYDELCRVGVRQPDGSISSIPRLQEVFDLVRANEGAAGAFLDIEIKYNGHERGDFIDRIAGIIHANGLEGRCVVTSFSYDCIMRLKGLLPGVLVGKICSQPEDFLALYGGADIFSLDYLTASAGTVEQLHAAGKEVYVWGVDDASRAYGAGRLGADVLISNNPVTIKSLVSAM
ncbi:MAG: glycerophosphodiester phosphodiesterase family protein [Eubacteriales bacterium]|nr:glycerophosphodiester phosphodiesterase family protein [Eubacteriales bacterium]